MKVYPSQITGKIKIPPSKSQTFRAILFASLAHGESIIKSPLQSPDTAYLIQACRSLGAGIEEFGNQLLIKGTGGKLTRPKEPLYVGNSGIALRFLTGIAAAFDFEVILMGDDALQKKRPMSALFSGLKQLGVQVVSFQNDGFAPLKLKGPLRLKQAVIDGQDSQPVSALLIAAALSNGHFEIIAENSGERPWVNLTLHWLKKLGVKVEQDNFEGYKVFGGINFKGFHYQVPGDYSSLAFPLVAALITDSELLIENLDAEEPQGDKKIIDVLKKMGALIEDEPFGLKVKKGSCLKGQIIDVNDFIDAVPILAVLGCFAKEETVLINASIARTKECDRLFAVVHELKKMGANIEQTKDGIKVKHSELKGCEMDSHGDHRIALSLAVAAMGASSQSVIKNSKCINKTYHSFIKDFQNLGVKIE